MDRFFSEIAAITPQKSKYICVKEQLQKGSEVIVIRLDFSYKTSKKTCFTSVAEWAHGVRTGLDPRAGVNVGRGWPVPSGYGG